MNERTTEHINEQMNEFLQTTISPLRRESLRFPVGESEPGAHQTLSPGPGGPLGEV